MIQWHARYIMDKRLDNNDNDRIKIFRILKFIIGMNNLRIKIA